MNTNLLRSARLGGGLTFREIGTAARLDPSAISHYEAKRINPSASAFERWRQALRLLLTQRAVDISNALKTI